MDCDYDPKNTQKELIENARGKKKRRRKSKFAKMISEPRPPFNPNDKTYQEYIDEYYKFDCEDIIGDIPCKFKYREVIPNSFGLSVEEILLAKDRELSRWCSLKKAVQRRPENQEKYDQIAYERKSQNIPLKKKILPSLFEPEEKEEEVNVEKIENENTSVSGGESINSKKKKKKETKCENVAENNEEIINSNDSNVIKEESQDKTLSVVATSNTELKKKKKKRKNKQEAPSLSQNEKTSEKTNGCNQNIDTASKNRKRKKHSSNIELPFKKQKRFGNKESDIDIGISDARLSAYGIKAKKFKNKLKYGNKSS